MNTERKDLITFIAENREHDEEIAEMQYQSVFCWAIGLSMDEIWKRAYYISVYARKELPNCIHYLTQSLEPLRKAITKQ